MSKEYDVAPATIYKWIDLYSKSNESSVSKADFLELKRQLGDGLTRMIEGDKGFFKFF
ncbi:hypothetical protein [Lactococcus lactis]|uniref:hypothetical protein n=1 Tax=Lactococcus lactis TaxID=1358 RepID=UPI00356B6E25